MIMASFACQSFWTPYKKAVIIYSFSIYRYQDTGKNWPLRRSDWKPSCLASEPPLINTYDAFFSLSIAKKECENMACKYFMKI